MNLGRLLADAARHHGDRPSFIYGDDTWTYVETDRRVDAMATALRALGAVKGDRIATIGWNRPELVESMFVAFRLGLVLVPLNPRHGADEIAYHLQDPEVRYVFHAPDFSEVVAEAVAISPSVEHRIAFGAEPVDGALGYEELVAEHSGGAPIQTDTEPDDLAWLFYTSGTTGRPKGAMITHANLMFMTLGWIADLMPLTADDTALHIAPLSHGAGFHAIAAVAKAVRQVIPVAPSLTAHETLQVLRDFGVTNTWMVPTQINRIVDVLEKDPVELPALTTLLYGGAPFHADDLRRAVEQFGAALVQLYGQGETPMTATYLPGAEHLAALTDSTAAARLASAGFARTGIDIEVLDESGTLLPDGEIGEIAVRGATVMRGYWNLPEASAEALRGGWLHTGDIGRMEAGYLFVIDRAKDMIISGGSNVYAREVEEFLLHHKSVIQVAVVGLPDRDWGERVVAVIVTDPAHPTTPADFKAFCRDRIASYKTPKEFVIVDELPVSNYGKVLKRELRDQLSARPAAQE